MNSFKILGKTMPFILAKVGVQIASLVIASVLGGLVAIIFLVTKEALVGWIAFFVWLISFKVADLLLNKYIGYLVKVGHIAVIQELLEGGEVPSNQLKYGMDKVRTHFKEASVYFLVDSLVSGAVKQLQSGVNKVGNLFESIPAMSTIFTIINLFIGIFLNYVDECCIAYSISRPEESAFKSAADAVSIYFKQWKKLSVNAIKIVAIVMLSGAIFIVIPTIAWGFLTISIWETALPGVIIGLFFGLIIHSVIKENVCLVMVMAGFIPLAKETEIEGALYEKLCGLSAKFKELFHKGQQAI